MTDTEKRVEEWFQANFRSGGIDTATYNHGFVAKADLLKRLAGVGPVIEGLKVEPEAEAVAPKKVRTERE